MKVINKIDAATIIEAISSGKTVVMPFDTVYGLMANPFDDLAMEKIYQIKGRDFNKPIALIFSSIHMLKKFIPLISTETERYIAEKVPGGYTFILPWSKKDRRKFSLHYQKLDKIGFRIPDNKLLLDLISQHGKPIAATSANISGKENCWSADEFINQIKNQKEKPDYIFDGGELIASQPSKVIDISSTSDIKILRN